MDKYLFDSKFYYERYLIRNYNSKVILAMIKISNINRRSSFTLSQLSKISGESISKVKSTIYKMIDEYMINNLKIELIPSEYKVNELFIVQFPYKMEDFSFLFEVEIDELLELNNNEIKVFLMLFGFVKGSDEYKSKGLKQVYVGIDTIAHFCGVKNLNTLVECLKSLEEKKWIKTIEKGNNLKHRNTKYEITKEYQIR